MAPGERHRRKDAFGALSAVMKTIGMQITGGSTTVADSFVKLRQAGAVARETLKLAASAKDRYLPVRAEDRGRRGAAARRLVAPYAELAADRRGDRAAAGCPLRDPSEWRLIGKPMQRVDIVAKSTGTQSYGIDHKVDGMVHAAIRLNPRRPAR
jgi:isoquinoline 1-oxidoreductase beta subunit